MNHLITECNELLKNKGFKYAICGGFALELYIGKEIRSHSDIDVFFFENDKKAVIAFLQQHGWNVFKRVSGEFICYFRSPDEFAPDDIAVFCIKPNCSFIEHKPFKDNMYAWKTISHEQKNFDFIEVIFNLLIDRKVTICQFPGISRPLEKAILYHGDIPYMSPELVLFCKAMTVDRTSYQLDFDLTVPFLSNESKGWLIKALEVSYPEGHKWLDLLKGQ